MKQLLKERLISDVRESENSMFNLVGLIVYPNDPYYGMLAVEANEVCKEVLGDKYELFEADGLFAGVMYRF